ncbi:MAG: DUF5606 domain-containing protein [Draconibacterium sp.]
MLKGILSVSGHSGLFKLVAEAKNNIVVESLDTNKRMPVYSTAKVSSLEDIAIFTENEDMPLKDVFKAINNLENGGAAISVKSTDKELKAYFQKVLPEYDKDRVYVSDIKKVLLWYNALHEKNLLDFSEPDTKEAEGEKTEDAAIS